MDLGKLVKRAVESRGMIGWQFNTVGVSDAITMGGEGSNMHLPLSLSHPPLCLTTNNSLSRFL